MRLRTLTVVATGLMLAMGAAPARADVIPLLINVEPSFVNPGNFLWTYLATINPGQKQSSMGSVPGVATPEDETRSILDYLTIYDWSGFTGVVIADPTLYRFQALPFGSTPALTNPLDGPIVNITLYRNPDNPLELTGAFTFAIESTFDRPVAVQGYFASDATKNAPGTPSDNTGLSNAGRVEAPFRVQQVPEPGTLLLVGAGLFGLGIYRRKKS